MELPKVCECQIHDEYLTVSEEDSVLSIAKLFRNNRGIRHIMVVDEQQILKGIISLSDIVTKVVAENLDPSTVKARDVMETNVITVNENDTIDKVFMLMGKYKFIILPVVDSQRKLKGVISLHDVLSKVREIRG